MPTRPVSAAPIVSETQDVASATELFGMPPQTRPNAFKPRIVSVFEHVPATVSQPVAAEPVRATREAGPAYAPKGTELFASTAPKQWDLPALDYGSALSHAEPPQPVVATPKPIEPMRIVARELPQSATEMFGLGAPEKLRLRSRSRRCKSRLNPWLQKHRKCCQHRSSPSEKLRCHCLLRHR